MFIKEALMRYNELKECKTAKELFEKIPISFIHKIIYVLLSVWLINPLITMLTNIFSFSSPIIFLHTILLQLGYLCFIVGIFGFIKLHIINDFKFYDKTYFKKSLPFIFMFLLLIWSLISAFLADDYQNSFFGDLYRKEGFLTYLAYAGFFISVIILFDEKYREKLLLIFSTVATILSVFTIIQIFGYSIPGFENNSRFSAVFYNINHFGYYLTMTMICVSCLFITATSVKRKLFFLTEYVLITIALIFNNTFGCYLTVFVTLIACIFIFSLKNNKFSRISLLPFIMFLFISLLINTNNKIIENNFLSLFTDATKIISNDETVGQAGSSRWKLWVNALDFIKNRPIFGYGPDSLGKPYEELNIKIDRPHNEYLQFAASLGIPALIFYLSALFLVFKRAFKNRKNISTNTIIALCSVLAYLVSAFFGNTMFYTSPYFFILLAISFNIVDKEHIKNGVY